MIKFTRILIVSFLLSTPFVLEASHIAGGEIRVVWVGPSQNDFQIQVRVFRFCGSGAASMPLNVTVNMYNKTTNGFINTYSLPRVVLTPNLPFGDNCFTPQGLCIDEGIFTLNVTIPDNPSGYYLSYQVCCRNAGILNIATPASAGMTFYCEIPDPANLQAQNNSNPDFGPYPLDAYLCVNNIKNFSFNVTDPDGDSLAYSLLTPLNNTPNGAGPYNPINWAGGFSLANIVGGTPPMSINAQTGVITASPGLIGAYVFAVRVEEFRNGIKIGETRRDVQYEGFNCTVDSPPLFANNINNGDTLSLFYNREFCESLVFQDPNTTDTAFMTITTDITDSGAYFPVLTPVSSGPPPLYQYFYDYGTNSVTIPANGFDSTENAYFNIGTVAQRFCWKPKCNTIDKIYSIKVNSFSLGCAGKVSDSVEFYLYVIPPTGNLDQITEKEVTYNKEYCQDIVFADSSIIDTLRLQIISPILALGATFPQVNQESSGNYLYFDANGDSVLVPSASSINVVQPIAKRVCWVPDCDQIGQTFPIIARLWSVECPEGFADTMSYQLTVNPPFDTLALIPNVMTPNGDGMNDTYKIDGVSNPCNDRLKVEIYNRWGINVYDSEDPNFVWDGKNNSGKKVPAGTYFVVIKGIYGSEEIIIEKRTVTVLD